VEIPQEYSQALSCNGQEASEAQAGVVSVKRTEDESYTPYYSLNDDTL